MRIMRTVTAVAMAVMLSGCATHRSHVAHTPDPLHDWATVRALKPGTSIRATVGYNNPRDGVLDQVSDSTLTIRMTPTPTNPVTVTIDRARIGSVSANMPKKTRWGWLGKPLAAGIVGGIVGTFAGAAMKDAKVAGISAGVFAGCAFGGLVHFMYHWDDTDFRVVYVRP